MRSVDMEEVDEYMILMEDRYGKHREFRSYGTELGARADYEKLIASPARKTLAVRLCKILAVAENWDNGESG